MTQPARTQASDGTPYDVLLESTVMVPMRDGIRLASDIYRPSRDGKPVAGAFPVIMERTPYGRATVSRAERSLRHPEPLTRDEVAAIFVSRGYVVVYQDCRGRFGSEGIFRKYLDDAEDGYDMCAWLVAQPWCNGKIGTMGLSYAAHTQAALASMGAPGVAAMFLDSGGFANSYQDGIRQGGAYELKQATWAYNNALLAPEVRADRDLLAKLREVDMFQWFARLREQPWSRGDSPVTLAPEYEDYLFEQWEHGDFDEYWKQPGIYAEGYYDQFPDCPQVHMSSWYDPYPRTVADNYVALSRAKQGPVRLILGPWTHGNRSTPYSGDVDFGAEATLDEQLAADFWELRVRWFDQWLRGVENGVREEPAVRYFLMGGGSGLRNEAGRMQHGGHWRTAEDWPVPGTQFTSFYLHADGGLLATPQAGEVASLTYEYDPAHPVPTIGGTVTSGEPIMVGGAFDQREDPRFFGSEVPSRALAERADVLVFQTEPLSTDVEVTGAVEANLWISSDCVDTDFTIKLVDVYPPNEDYPQGFAMNVTDGIQRVRYRDSWEAPTLMSPGEVYLVRVSAFPTSNLFKAGHRIRLDVSSSNYPHFDLNYNTGEPEGHATRSQVARNTIYLDAARPSHVVLPLVTPVATG